MIKVLKTFLLFYLDLVLCWENDCWTWLPNLNWDKVVLSLVEKVVLLTQILIEMLSGLVNLTPLLCTFNIYLWCRVLSEHNLQYCKDCTFTQLFFVKESLEFAPTFYLWLWYLQWDLARFIFDVCFFNVTCPAVKKASFLTGEGSSLPCAFFWMWRYPLSNNVSLVCRGRFSCWDWHCCPRPVMFEISVFFFLVLQGRRVSI